MNKDYHKMLPSELRILANAGDECAQDTLRLNDKLYELIEAQGKVWDAVQEMRVQIREDGECFTSEINKISELIGRIPKATP